MGIPEPFARGWRRLLPIALSALALGALSVRAQDPDSVRPRTPATASADGAPSGTAAAVVSRARALLDADMPVTASRMLARELSLGVLDGFEAVILAARAQAAQRSWGAVRRLLVGRDWTDPDLEAEALLLLAGAYTGLDSAARAVETYDAYLTDAPDPVPAAVRVDAARALTRIDRHAAAAAHLAAAATDYPQIGRWARLSRFYALALADDPSAYALADTLARTSLIPSDSVWGAAAALAFRLGDPGRGVSLARRVGPGVRRALAEQHIAPHLLATGDTSAAAAAYRSVVERGEALAETGPALLALDDSWGALRDAGQSDVRSGRASRGAGYLARALELAPPDAQPDIAEALAGAHRALGDHARAVQVLSPWLGGREASPERAASIWLLAARSLASLGRGAAAAEAYENAARGTGSSAAFAAYLIGDAHHDAERIEEAREAYVRSYRSFPSSSYGSRSLERLALLDYREGRYAEARSHLGEYRRRYPQGDWAQGALYWTAKTYDAEGDSARARTLYVEAVDYGPLDYYAILAGERLDRDRWDALRLRPAEPLVELDPVHAAALERMMLLRDLGWVSRARREYRGARERGPRGWAHVLAWAHALNAQGWTQEGVAEGWRAKSQRVGWTRQLLEAIYPLPFPEALAHAAREWGLDPHFVAGLSRRESLFDPEIRSAASAIGLMQLLPTTARDVAPRAGLPEYRLAQLTVPQVNLLLGTRYLADVLDRFGGAPIAGMISYNAGPHRYVRWREFPEFADAEQLVERIPFRETREYVRAVMELTEIYRFLYPELGSRIP